MKKFLVASLAFALGVLLGTALAMDAYASYQTEYTFYEPAENSIQITGEIYEQTATFAESIKSTTKSDTFKPPKTGFRTFPGVSGQTLCSCVETAKILANKEFGSIGLARNLKGNTATPEVGDIIITDESSAGHLAVIKQIWANTYVIMEGNYERCTYTEREISKTYNKIISFYH